MPFDIAKDLAPDAPVSWYVECGQHKYRVLALDEDDYCEATTPFRDPDDEEPVTHVGMCNRTGNVIWLRLEYHGEPIAVSRLREHLLHEVMHVAYGQSGLRYGHVTEEDAVSSITPSLHDILVRNPWLIDALDLK